MSTCISQHGEYSSHELDTDLRCKLCGVLDEDALLNRARNAWHTLAFVDQTSYANRDNSAAVTWRNDEVMALLDDIRAALIIGPESHGSTAVDDVRECAGCEDAENAPHACDVHGNGCAADCVHRGDPESHDSPTGDTDGNP